MELMIKSTNQLTNLDGVPARVWKGVTSSGVECIVFVHRIAVANDKDATEFERELAEQMPPGRATPLSMIL